MLLFNPITKKQIKLLLNDLPQGLLLCGATGAGLLSTARYIAGTHIAAVIEPSDKDGNVNHEKGTITVKRIRELYDQTRSKSLQKQIFIIDNADKMSTGAQNAFLKLLEEPNDQVAFILTTHSQSLLLPTIVSRVEKLNILPITREQSEQLLLGYKLPISKVGQALFVAVGRPAELARLASDTDYFDAKASIMGAAKTFITGNRTDRLQTAFNYSSDREKALQLLAASIAIVRFTIKNNPTTMTIEQADRLARAYDAIAANGNTKLHLVATMVY